MNFRLAAFLFLVLTVPGARARIIVDDSAPEAGPDRPGINVPGPKGDEAPEQAAAPQEDSLLFVNKDQLHGKLLGIDKDGLRWQSHEAAAAIVFRNTNVAEVRLNSHAAAGKDAQRVGLTNNDQLPGTVVALDEKALTLDTWYAGRLVIPRAMLSEITPLSEAGAVLYEGPTGMEGWKIGNMGGGRSWSFHGGALVGSSYGSIGRDMKLPAMSSVQFDYVSRGNGQLSVSLYSDRADGFGNCYMLQLNTNFAEMQRYAHNGGSSDLGNVQLQGTLRHDKVHVELRTNKEKKSIWLFIDGKMAKEWIDPGDFNGRGGAVLFACQPGSYVRITDIKATPWDGKFEDSTNKEEKSQDDTVKLANQDKVTGQLKGIQDGKVTFASSYAELKIPMDRIQEMDFAAAKATTPKAAAGSVRVMLPEEGSITMDALSWEAKSCTGLSPNFGKAIFLPGAFSRILFNLSKQPAAGDAEDFPGDATGGDGGDQ